MFAAMTEQRPRTASPETADFGYRTVPKTEKTALVRALFDTVAERYDLMNDLMSLGIHRWWKSAMVDCLSPRPGQHVLDVAGGTGDIAGRIVRSSRGRTRVTVCDISVSMLGIGRDRAIDRGMSRGIDWLVGAAERLPLADRTADAYTIAFGIRNVADIPAALAEARRVLKPGGRFLCLEFSPVVLPGLAKLYDLYSFKLLPEIGARVTGDREAYQYLVESIRRFPDQARFAGMIADAGLGRINRRGLSGGIAALDTAWRI